MANMGDADFDLDLSGDEGDGEVCYDCVASERVHYASSVAESLVVFVNRVRAGETGISRNDVLGLAHHFMDVLERRERGCLCENCCPELHGENP